MKADLAVQRRLLALAEADGELTRLAHRRRNLPELAELTEAEAEVRARKDKVVEAETAAGDLDREIARIERDVDGVRARAERDNTLLAGAGLPAKQAADLQHELDALARRQSVLEDEELEIMERREALGIDVEHSRGELASAEDKVVAIAERRDTALADIDAATAGRTRDRDALAAVVPADVLGLYETRREKGGTGAAALVQRRCGACRLELDRTALAALRGAPADEVVRCSECGVILVRSAESGL